MTITQTVYQPTRDSLLRAIETEERACFSAFMKGIGFPGFRASQIAQRLDALESRAYFLQFGEQRPPISREL